MADNQMTSINLDGFVKLGEKPQKKKRISHSHFAVYKKAGRTCGNITLNFDPDTTCEMRRRGWEYIGISTNEDAKAFAVYGADSGWQVKYNKTKSSATVNAIRDVLGRMCGEVERMRLRVDWYLNAIIFTVDDSWDGGVMNHYHVSVDLTGFSTVKAKVTSADDRSYILRSMPKSENDACSVTLNTPVDMLSRYTSEDGRVDILVNQDTGAVALVPGSTRKALRGSKSIRVSLGEFRDDIVKMYGEHRTYMMNAATYDNGVVYTLDHAED